MKANKRRKRHKRRVHTEAFTTNTVRIKADAELSPLAMEALSMMTRMVDVIEVRVPGMPSHQSGFTELGVNVNDYDSLIESANSEFSWKGPEDEWDAISINYSVY